MSYHDIDDLKITLEENTLWIYLNRPKASNAFSEIMIQNFIKTLYQADSDESVRSIVISGEGRHFCAGGDVKGMQEQTGMFAGESNELRDRYRFGIQQIPKCMESLSTPIIAMVNGAAIGAGLDLACMCDIRIASENAKFGETFAKLGLIPGDGGTYFLQRIIGYAKAMELTLTCEIINAQLAKEIGLVKEIVSSDKLLDKTKQLVKLINSNAPMAVQMAKRSMIHAYRNDLNSNLELLSAFQAITQRSEDHRTALDSLGKNEVNFFKYK